MPHQLSSLLGRTHKNLPGKLRLQKTLCTLRGSSRGKRRCKYSAHPRRFKAPRSEAGFGRLASCLGPRYPTGRAPLASILKPLSLTLSSVSPGFGLVFCFVDCFRREWRFPFSFPFCGEQGPTRPYHPGYGMLAIRVRALAGLGWVEIAMLGQNVPGQVDNMGTCRMRKPWDSVLALRASHLAGRVESAKQPAWGRRTDSSACRRPRHSVWIRDCR